MYILYKDLHIKISVQELNPCKTGRLKPESPQAIQITSALNQQNILSV